MEERKAPPIQYLTVLDAAARHLSFKLAAQELCVSGPAVAQQIKAFEQWLGRSLFNRHTRALSLTEEGEYYAAIAKEVMSLHRQGYIDYVRTYEKSSMTVSAPFFVAQEMLMPNYFKFQQHLNGTELRIETRMSYVDFSSETIDAAIRFGDGHWPELHCLHLCDATVSPVCSQEYLDEHEYPATELDNIYQQRLIYALPEMGDWGKQLQAEEKMPLYENIVCDSYINAIKAASDGLGMALGIFPTANAWVNDGKVLLPYGKQIKTDKSYWLVCPKANKDNEEIQALYAWVKEIFEKLPALEVEVKEITVTS